MSPALEDALGEREAAKAALRACDAEIAAMRKQLDERANRPCSPISAEAGGLVSPRLQMLVAEAEDRRRLLFRVVEVARAKVTALRRDAAVGG